MIGDCTFGARQLTIAEKQFPAFIDSLGRLQKV